MRKYGGEKQVGVGFFFVKKLEYHRCSVHPHVGVVYEAHDFFLFLFWKLGHVFSNEVSRDKVDSIPPLLMENHEFE